MDQKEWIENQEIDPSISGNWVYEKDYTSKDWGKNDF